LAVLVVFAYSNQPSPCGTKGAGIGGRGGDLFGLSGLPDALPTATGISILLGTGKAVSPFGNGTPIAVTGAACPVAGDLNGGGIPDLLVPVNGTPNALLAYIGNGDGTFFLKSTTPTPNSGGSVVLADINHDGKLDFITSGNLLGLGNGDGTFKTPVPFVTNPPSFGFSNIAVGSSRWSRRPIGACADASDPVAREWLAAE